MSQSEQTLEWTAQLRFCGMFAVHHFLIDIIFGIPVMMLLLLIPRSLVMLSIVVLPCVAVLLLIILFGNRPNRKLHVNRQVIALAETNTFGVRERRVTTAGAKVRAVHFDFIERLFTFDFFRISFAYHVEVTRNDETLLFPCVDETEQRQIITKIKEFELKD